MRDGAPNTLMLHLYHQGELDDPDRSQVKAAIDADPDTRRRYQALLAAEADFAVQPIPEALAVLSRPPVPAWRRWLPVWGPAVGLAAVAATALLIAGPVLPGSGVPSDPPGYIGTKGALPDLEVWIAGESGPRPLGHGERVGAGDTVQLAFDPHDHRYVTLAGRDGTGTLEVYRTISTAGMTGLTTAPFSLVLDDAPGPQEFLVLGHDEPLTDREVIQALEEGGAELRSLSLDKR